MHYVSVSIILGGYFSDSVISLILGSSGHDQVMIL
uniref:Uncharacterized protein n=1 Tax=Manihot esculenta TaxID=3983 RepID=A0A2C9W0P8_MANES